MAKSGDRFTSEQLEAIEARLWELATTLDTADMNLPPLDDLLGASSCDFYAEDLVAYARDRAANTSAHWQNHPLVFHLERCAFCRRTLADLELKYRQGPMPTSRPQQPTPAIDLTIFDQELPKPEADVRSALDPRRPVLLYSGFLAEPEGWYFTLETEAHVDGSFPDVVLTLIPPEGIAAGVTVTLITLGQILHAVTDEQGQARFGHVHIPPAEWTGTPLLSLRLQMPSDAL